MSSTVITQLKYPFDIKNIKPYQSKVRDDFSCRTKTTYNISCFSSVKYATGQALRDYKQQHPSFKDFEHEVYARFAESKLPENTTICNALKYTFSVNKYKKIIFVNIQMLFSEPATNSEQVQEDPQEADLSEEEDVIDEPPIIVGKPSSTRPSRR